jgi:hypothetical protein
MLSQLTTYFAFLAPISREKSSALPKIYFDVKDHPFNQEENEESGRENGEDSQSVIKIFLHFNTHFPLFLFHSITIYSLLPSLASY